MIPRRRLLHEWLLALFYLTLNTLCDVHEVTVVELVLLELIFLKLTIVFNLSPRFFFLFVFQRHSKKHVLNVLYEWKCLWLIRNRVSRLMNPVRLRCPTPVLLKRTVNSYWYFVFSYSKRFSPWSISFLKWFSCDVFRSRNFTHYVWDFKTILQEPFEWIVQTLAVNARCGTFANFDKGASGFWMAHVVRRTGHWIICQCIRGLNTFLIIFFV